MRMNGGWDFAMAWIADLVKSGLFGERHTQLRHADMDARITSIQLRVPAHSTTHKSIYKSRVRQNCPRPRHVLKIEDLIVYCIFSVKFELCNLLRWPQDGILWRFSITHQQTRTTCSLYEKSWYESLKKTDIGRIIADFSTWIHLVNTFQPRTGLKVWL